MVKGTVPKLPEFPALIVHVQYPRWLHAEAVNVAVLLPPAGTQIEEGPVSELP